MIRNIASTLRPVITMGSPGSYFLYRLDTMWDSWRMSGTAPRDIDYGNTMGLSAVFTVLPFTTTLFSSSSYPDGVGRRGIYLENGTAPTGGDIYAGDPNYSEHFPVVRQGRYLYYGFYEVPNMLNYFHVYYNYMGKLFFTNLVYRMSLY